VDLLAKKMANIRALGACPGDNQPVTVRKGRFGPYVQHGNTVANLPRAMAMEDVTLPEALTLLAEKGKALKPRGGAARKQQGTAKRQGKAAGGATAPAASPGKRVSAASTKPARRGAAARRAPARRDAAE
jgi:DNA topoisomerase I